jgi:cell division protein FtsB
MRKRPFLSRLKDPQAVISALLLLGVVVLSLGVFRGETSLSRYFQLKKSQLLLDKTVTGLEAENRQLADEIMRLKKSKNYARKVLRDKYHVTDADENIVFFPE